MLQIKTLCSFYLKIWECHLQNTFKMHPLHFMHSNQQHAEGRQSIFKEIFDNYFAPWLAQPELRYVASWWRDWPASQQVCSALKRPMSSLLCKFVDKTFCPTLHYSTDSALQNYSIAAPIRECFDFTVKQLKMEALHPYLSTVLATLLLTIAW